MATPWIMERLEIKVMTYREFHDILKRHLTELQITTIQKVAFKNYEDAHGYKPKRKEQKQLAYDFMIDFICNMDVTECVRYLKPFGIPLITAITLWHGLE